MFWMGGEMMERRYLGDGVYVEIERGMLKLTTEEGGPHPSNAIYLEPEVYIALTKFYSEAVEHFQNKRDLENEKP